MNAVMKHSRFRHNSLVISALLCVSLFPALAAAQPPALSAPPPLESLVDHVPDTSLAMAGHVATTVSSVAIDSLRPAPGPLDIISIGHIFFDFDKADLDGRAKKTLDVTAAFIQDYHRIQRVLIEGNTDEIASKDYNYNLADRRVSSVRNYLSTKGVPNDLLYTAGLGKSRPIDENWTRQGRRRNRHVEIYLIAYPASSLQSPP